MRWEKGRGSELRVQAVIWWLRVRINGTPVLTSYVTLDGQLFLCVPQFPVSESDTTDQDLFNCTIPPPREVQAVVYLVSVCLSQDPKDGEGPSDLTLAINSVPLPRCALASFPRLSCPFSHPPPQSLHSLQILGNVPEVPDLGHG